MNYFMHYESGQSRVFKSSRSELSAKWSIPVLLHIILRIIYVFILMGATQEGSPLLVEPGLWVSGVAGLGFEVHGITHVVVSAAVARRCS